MAVRRPSVRRPSTSSVAGPSESPGGQGVTVPKLNKDPVWSLRPWPIDVTIGGELATIPAVPATDWLVYLLREKPDIDGLITELMSEIEDQYYEQQLPLNELYELVLEVLATASARPWWVAIRLIGIAANSWDLIGPELAFHGIDADAVSLSAWLDAVLIIALQNMDPKTTTMFTMRLEAPPPQASGTGEQPEIEISRDTFLSYND